MTTQIRHDAAHAMEQTLKHFLSRLPLGQQSTISCELNQTELSLAGSVSSFYEKQLVQEQLRQRVPSLTINNELKVQRLR